MKSSKVQVLGKTLNEWVEVLAKEVHKDEPYYLEYLSDMAEASFRKGIVTGVIVDNDGTVWYELDGPESGSWSFELKSAKVLGETFCTVHWKFKEHSLLTQIADSRLGQPLLKHLQFYLARFSDNQLKKVLTGVDDMLLNAPVIGIMEDMLGTVWYKLLGIGQGEDIRVSFSLSMNLSKQCGMTVTAYPFADLQKAGFFNTVRRPRTKNLALVVNSLTL